MEEMGVLPQPAERKKHIITAQQPVIFTEAQGLITGSISKFGRQADKTYMDSGELDQLT